MKTFFELRESLASASAAAAKRMMSKGRSSGSSADAQRHHETFVHGIRHHEERSERHAEAARQYEKDGNDDKMEHHNEKAYNHDQAALHYGKALKAHKLGDERERNKHWANAHKYAELAL